VYVTDVDRAIGFYVDALGFEKRSDARMGPIRAGVRFDEEPHATAWGTQAIIADPDGNTFVVVAA
jgi:predicted enzyme related to lactoylglutathione lyase